MTARKQVLDFILVYLLLFTSGSMLFITASDKYLIIVLVVCVLAWFFFSERKIHDKFILLACVFLTFLLIIYFYTSGSMILSSILGTMIKLFIAYLILSVVAENFINTFIKVVVFLAGFSLFGFMTDQLHLFEGIVRLFPRVNSFGYEGVFYLYRYYYEGFERNNSIFFEPGAYQGILNAALFMLLFVKLDISNTRRGMYIAILLITLYTTYSTTGYLIFAGMFGLFLMKGKAISTSAKAVLVGVIIVGVTAFSSQFQHVIFEKIESFAAIEDITDSDNRRSFDLLVDIEIFKTNIFGVGYTKYYEKFSSVGLARKGAVSSNGISKTLAIYGLPFSLFYFGLYYLSLMRLLEWKYMAIFPFSMFLMFLFGESYFVFTPLCLTLIVAPLLRKKTTAESATDYGVDMSMRSQANQHEA